MRRELVAATAFVGALASRAAPAQEVARAERAFNDGLTAMLAGRYDDGCPLIAESYRLDPQPGALFTLAECEARWGKVTKAVAHFEQYLQLYAAMTPVQRQEQGDRPELALTTKTEMAARIARLTLVPPPGAPAGMRVGHNGEAVPAGALGASLEVDPGEHVVLVEAPGRRAQEMRVTLAPGASQRIDLVVGAALDEATPAAPPGPPPGSSTPRSDTVAARDTAAEEGAGIPAQRIVAYTAGGIGVAALMLGAITGAAALAEKDAVDEHCPALECDPEGLAAVDDGRRWATLSTVAFVVGAAALASSVVLFVTEPDEDGGTPAARRQAVPRLSVALQGAAATIAARY
jgi:hypothetical protein